MLSCFCYYRITSNSRAAAGSNDVLVSPPVPAGVAGSRGWIIKLEVSTGMELSRCQWLSHILFLNVLLTTSLKSRLWGIDLSVIAFLVNLFSLFEFVVIILG